MKTQFDHFNLLSKFSFNFWNIVSKRIKKICDFWTCPRKIEIKVQPIDLLSWIKFRGPELNQGSSLQNFRFVGLSSRSEPRGHKPSFELHTEATRKDPRASFGILNLCAKFQDHILTGSILSREAKWPPKGHICACLI